MRRRQRPAAPTTKRTLMPHRTFLHAAAAGALLLALAGCATDATAPDAPSDRPGASTPRIVDVAPALKALESQFDAQVGVSAVDTETGRAVEYRPNQRFGYASTLKVFA